jgi:hypothetical protein
VSIETSAGVVDSLYHQVIETDKALILVFDRRFKYGMRFCPAESSNAIRVTVEGDGASESYSVMHVGLKFVFAGCYEFTVLLRTGDEAASAGDDTGADNDEATA